MIASVLQCTYTRSRSALDFTLMNVGMFVLHEEVYGVIRISVNINLS